MATPLLIGAVIVTGIVYMMRLESQLSQELSLDQFRAEQQLVSYPPTPASYDFIIVGGGSAGCLIAGKLSENFSVLLLEAGGPPPELSRVPALRSFVAEIEGYNWNYDSIPQPHALNRIISRSVGKMLGGSFASNLLVYNRGNQRDYETWYNLTGDRTWKHENVLELFKQIEMYTGPYKSASRGTNGPIHIHPFFGNDLEAYKLAAAELGLTYGDGNGISQPNISPIDFSQTKNRDQTTCSIFIEPFLGIRDTLKVLTYAEVTEVLFEDKTAQGVVYQRHGKEFTALAKKEVILSAGVFGTPFILWKSGIGPSQMLIEAEIETLVDLPVGTQMENHPRLPFNVTTGNDSIKQIATLEYNLTDEGIESFFSGEKYELLDEVGMGPQGYFASSRAKAANESDWPDIQFLRFPASVASDGTPFALISIQAGRPMAVGSLKLNTTAYLNGERENTRLAIVDYNLFDNEEDKQTLIEGAQTVFQLFNTSGFARLDMQLLPNEICAQDYPILSDEYWQCHLLREGHTFHHQVGTCRMGHKGDPNSVVDMFFRVKGIERLRIIDSSVFPRITNTNTNAATILLAHVGTEKILRHYRSACRKKSASCLTYN